MVKQIFSVLICFVCATSVIGQDLNRPIQWIVMDREVSRSFLNIYGEIALELGEEQGVPPGHFIQSDSDLRVEVTVEQDSIIPVNISAITRGGQIKTLIDPILDRMPKEQKELLYNRKYEWDNFNPTDTSTTVEGSVINVFEERNSKEVRDNFWWTYREFQAGFPQTLVRPKGMPKTGFEISLGNPSFGFPVNASRNINAGVAFEIVKAYLIIPYPFPKLLNNQPLDAGYGFGLNLDTRNFGGAIAFQEIGAVDENDNTFYDDNSVYNNFGLDMYYSNTYRYPENKFIPIPEGTLRLKMGISYMEFVYGKWDDENTEFIQLARSERLESFLINFRIQYTSDPSGGEKFGKYKGSIQFNVGMRSLMSTKISLGYNVFKFLRVSLNTAIFFNSYDFEYYDMDTGDEEIYSWTPGVFVLPSVTLFF